MFSSCFFFCVTFSCSVEWKQNDIFFVVNLGWKPHSLASRKSSVFLMIKTRQEVEIFMGKLFILLRVNIFRTECPFSILLLAMFGLYWRFSLLLLYFHLWVNLFLLLIIFTIYYSDPCRSIIQLHLSLDAI